MTWAMPRDMSGFSTLEAAMLAAINAAGLPEPWLEYRFAPPCCAHPKTKHRGPVSRAPQHWYYAGPTPARCTTCAADDIEGWSHIYDKGRRWRFDFAWPELMVAVECEGGTWTGGRHTSGAGFEKDAEKYSEAAIRGWTVLRFTQRQITSGEAIVQVERAISAARSRSAEARS